MEMFRPTEEALIQAGVEFVHPIEEVEEGNLQRRSKILEYRAHLSKQEEVKIAAEREEIKRAKQLLIQNGPRTPTQATIDIFHPPLPGELSTAPFLS